MRRFVSVAALAAATVSAAAATAAPAYVPRNSQWASEPAPSDIEQAIPPEYRAAGGRVLMRCAADAQGLVSDCRVIAEAPAGHDLGRAFLALAPKYRLKPEAVKDAAPDGTVVVGRNWYRTDSPGAWRHRPSAQDLVSVWPAKAFTRGGGGSATINCLIASPGSLYDCIVLTETPPGEGFGAAAIALTPQFQRTPPTRDGKPAIGSITIPVNFLASGVRYDPGRETVPGNPFIYNLPPTLAWADAPTAEDVAAAYPAGAKAARTTGFGGLTCGFDKDGRLKSCHLDREEPHGQGFGAAALALSKRFRLDPTVMGDKPITQAQVELLVTFDAATLDGSPRGYGMPVWKRAPDFDAFHAAFEAHKPTSDSGRAVLSCRVQQGGGMGDCSLVSEDPAGSGLGQAALALQGGFGVATWTSEGLPVVGRTVRFPVRFDMSEPPPAPAAAPTPAKAPAKP